MKQDMSGNHVNNLQKMEPPDTPVEMILKFVWGLIVGVLAAIFLLPRLGQSGSNYFLLPAVGYLVISLLYNKWQHLRFSVNFISVLGTFAGTVATLIVLSWL